MRTVIIGGTGHVGTYLVPRLVEAGHEVIAVSRQKRAPYQAHAAWGSVQQVEIDRTEAENQVRSATKFANLRLISLST